MKHGDTHKERAERDRLSRSFHGSKRHDDDCPCARCEMKQHEQHTRHIAPPDEFTIDW